MRKEFIDFLNSQNEFPISFLEQLFKDINRPIQRELLIFALRIPMAYENMLEFFINHYNVNTLLDRDNYIIKYF